MGDKYDIGWCRRRKFPSANVYRMLVDRELGNRRREGCHYFKGSREFYYTMPINHSQTLLERPQFLPIRFTPDGKKLIGFNLQLQDVHIYDYSGVQNAMNVLVDRLFSALFPRSKTISFWNTGRDRASFGMLCKECALVTADSRYLIVISSVIVQESSSRLPGGIQKNNESLSPGTSGNLEDFTMYSIDLNKGEIVDSVKFDFEMIKPDQGMYLQDRMLAVLSIQHQTIHIFQIDRNGGHFIPVIQIGRFIYEDDLLYIGNAESAVTEKFFTGFRQRLLAYLYREHMKRDEVQLFYRNFEYYRSIKMHKIQFVGQELVLIRMDWNVLQLETASTQYMFVLLQWRVGQIIGVYKNSSEELFDNFEKFNESFKNGHLLQNLFPTSMEHSIYSRNHHEFLKMSTLLTTTNVEMRRRFLNVLPYSNTTVPIISPYLDPQLFSYDERLLTCLERGRFPLDQPLRLFSRRTGSLHTELEFYNYSRGHGHPYARVIFHPTDPFVISITKFLDMNSVSPMCFHTPISSPREICL